MLNFSELTLPQKKLIKEMRSGKTLSYNIQTYNYYLQDGQFTFKVKPTTAISLLNRYFIYECYHSSGHDTGTLDFRVNVEINYGKYLDEHNNLRWC
jgi:hypothetical protein